MPPIIHRRNNKIDDYTRQTIIDMVLRQGMNITHVARMFKYLRSTVKTIVDTFLQTNRVAKLPRGGSHNRRHEEVHINWLTDHLDEFAGRSVRWLTTQLNERFQLDPLITQRAVDKTLKKLTTFTLKLMRAELERYNDPEYFKERRRWAEIALQDPGNMNDFVYIDEEGFNLHITRNFGRAPRGRRTFQCFRGFLTTVAQLLSDRCSRQEGHTGHPLPTGRLQPRNAHSVFSDNVVSSDQ